MIEIVHHDPSPLLANTYEWKDTFIFHGWFYLALLKIICPFLSLTSSRG